MAVAVMERRFLDSSLIRVVEKESSNVGGDGEVRLMLVAWCANSSVHSRVEPYPHRDSAIRYGLLG